MNPQTDILSADDYAQWDEFVISTARGCIYSTTQYLDALCSSAGGSLTIVGARIGGKLTAGIALYEVSKRWGKTISPRTLLPYNGFVFSPGDAAYPSRRESWLHANQKSLARFIESMNYVDITIRCQPPFYDVRTSVDLGWVAGPTYTYVVPLEDMEGQWTLVDRKLRSQIKKAMALDYRVQEGSDFDTFYDHHHRASQEKGFPVYLPREEFRKYYEALENQSLAKLFFAISPAGNKVASQLVLCGSPPTCHIVAAGSSRKHDSSGVNALLRWGSFKCLSALGYSYADMTDASLNSVSRFKSKFGAELQLSLALSRKGGSKLRRGGARMESVVRNWLGR